MSIEECCKNVQQQRGWKHTTKKSQGTVQYTVTLECQTTSVLWSVQTICVLRVVVFSVAHYVSGNWCNMTLNLNLLRNAGVFLIVVGTLPLLRVMLAAILRLAPSSDFQPPAHLDAQYDFIVGEFMNTK